MSDPVTRGELEAVQAELVRMRDRLHALGTTVTKLDIQQRLQKTDKHRETQRTVGVSAVAGSVMAGAVYGLLQFFFGSKP